LFVGCLKPFASENVVERPRTIGTLLTLLVAALWLASPRPIQPGFLLIAAAVGGVAVWLGLAAARRVGTGAPILDGTVASPLAARRLAISLAVGAACGAVLLAVLVYGLVPFEPALATRLRARIGAPSWLPWALAVESSILEEFVLRLFLLSSIAWLLARGWRSARAPVSPVVSWSAITVSSLVFAAVHLPAWVATTNPTAMLIASVLTLNGVAGMVLGCLYWRWGIESAVLAHFAADMVGQGIGPRLVA
jgi:hypothetical protein